jgi:hypothetical protein
MVKFINIGSINSYCKYVSYVLEVVGRVGEVRFGTGAITIGNYNGNVFNASFTGSVLVSVVSSVECLVGVCTSTRVMSLKTVHGISE